MGRARRSRRTRPNDDPNGHNAPVSRYPDYRRGIEITSRALRNSGSPPLCETFGGSSSLIDLVVVAIRDAHNQAPGPLGDDHPAFLNGERTAAGTTTIEIDDEDPFGRRASV